MIDQLGRRFIRSLNAGRPAALVATALAATLLPAAGAHAASPVPLGTADSFALLAGSTITNTGSTTIYGDIGLCCSGEATPGFDQVTQPRGAQYIGTGSVAATAQDDLDIAYNNAAGQPVTASGGVDLSLRGTPANPLRPGVYQSTSRGALQINTGLTLDFQGNPNAVFIFQGTTLNTAANAGGSVTIVNGGSAPSTCNIYWQLSSDATGVALGTGSAFKGTTMALGASTLGTGATVEGRILTRRSKAVTLDTNTITQTACAAVTAGGGAAAGDGTAAGDGAAAGDGTAAGGGAAAGGGTAGPAASPALPAATPGAPSAAPTPTAAPFPGIARLTGPRAPVNRPFVVSVIGRPIKKVVFYIDGKWRRTVHGKRGRTKFKLLIDPRGQSRKIHTVRAKVTFDNGRTTSLRLIYRRPPTGASGRPRFTG